MTKFLIINNQNIVENIIVWDEESEWTAPEGMTMIIAPDGVSIGWKKDGDEWIAPEPAVSLSSELNRVSAREKLTALGLTEAEITALVGE
jgi:hypothetical protein